MSKERCINSECPFDTSRNRVPAEPSAIAKRALTLIKEYRLKTGAVGVPNEIQDEAWSIAFKPIESVPVLSRKRNLRGISKKVERKPSFLG